MATKLTTSEEVAALTATITTALSTFTAGLTDPTPPPPPNQPPVAHIDGPLSVTVGQAATYTATATDPDGTIVGIAWDGPVPGTGPTITWTPTTAGTYPIGLTATDNGGLSTRVAINVTAIAPPPPPTPEPAGVRVDLSTVGQRPDYVVPSGPGVITILPTQDAIAVVGAQAGGKTYVFAPGRHVLSGSGRNDSGIRPHIGDQFHGAPGSVITRNGGRGKAFIADAGVAGVRLQNLRIEDMVQGTTAETAAVTSLDAPGTYNTTGPGPNRTRGKGWVIDHCTITRCSAGIHAGTSTTVSWCDTSGCYGVGIKTFGEDVHLIACRSNGCNMVKEPGKASVMPWGGSYDTFYEAGGVKLWKGAGCTVVDCEANGNGGSGIWSDYGNAETYADPTKYEFRRILHCTANGNRSSGIAVEMTDRAEVAYNLCTGNQDWTSSGRKSANDPWSNGGISVYNAPGLWLHHNVVTGNDGAMVLQFRPRGPIGWAATPEQAPGPNVGVLGTVADCVIEDNVFDWTLVTSAGARVSGGGKTGIRQIPDDDYPTTDPATGQQVWKLHTKAELAPYWSGIVWRRNTYRATPGSGSGLTDSSRPFMVPSASRTVWDFDYLNPADWAATGRS